jgi:hypothetical protein
VLLKTIQAWVVPPTAISRKNVYAVVCCAVTPYICVSTFSINAISTASVYKRLFKAVPTPISVKTKKATI